MNLPPLPIGAPIALHAIRDAALEAQEPTKPGKLFACANADLPPASDCQYCQVLLTDLRYPVFSTYSGTAWEWTKPDGSAL
jgi:hypothetical protein